MSIEPRQPRAFDVDDPAILSEPEDATVGLAAPATKTLSSDRPTLSDLSQRGMRWGSILFASLAGASAFAAAAWFANFMSAALARDDWVGTTTMVLLLVAGFAAAMLVIRELIGFSRLSRLTRLKREIELALAERDQVRERRAALELTALYSGRRELVLAVQNFGAHARDIHDAGDLLRLADRDVLALLDDEARQIVTRSAKRVATVTALSPMALIGVTYVLVENLRLLRRLGSLYGARPGSLGVYRLARMVLTHMVATGGVAMTDDLLGQFLGQDLLRRVSRRLGEGAFNGALTARVGVTAIEVIRPLPFLATRTPRVRDILAEALKPLFSAKRPP